MPYLGFRVWSSLPSFVALCLFASLSRLPSMPPLRGRESRHGPPPPKPPPPKRGILRAWFFGQKERIFPGVHKIGAPISGPRIADTNFTDTRIFLNKSIRKQSIDVMVTQRTRLLGTQTLECRKWAFKRWGLSKSEDI